MSVVVLAGMGDLSLRRGSAVGALKSVHGLTVVQRPAGELHPI